MSPPSDSLLKYENPIWIAFKPKGRALRGSSKQPVQHTPVLPPPKLKLPPAGGKWPENEEILHYILPPREWCEEGKLFIQQVSKASSTKADVIHLQELLDTRLQQRQARDTGICPHRRELFSECFDELIRQVTINCAERGLLLLRVRDEVQMTISAQDRLFKSAMAYGVRKALQGDMNKTKMEKRISDLENEIQDLKEQINEQNNECDAIVIRASERREVEERKHAEEVQFLMETNKQLKDQMEVITFEHQASITPVNDE